MDTQDFDGSRETGERTGDRHRDDESAGDRNPCGLCRLAAETDSANIEAEIRDIFKRRCDLKSGGYLIIEPTEALVSIDVNSGRYTGKKDPEQTVLRTNMEAAAEIARHDGIERAAQGWQVGHRGQKDREQPRMIAAVDRADSQARFHPAAPAR